MRIWISGGGTAGHVYPALTVLEAARADAPDVLWLGMRGSIEAGIVSRHGLPFRPVAAGPLVGAAPARAVVSIARLARGTVASWRMMGRERPAAVLVTGGYVSVPVALAARLRRVPLAVFLPDVRPGRAVALVARLADRIAVTHDAARPFLPSGRVVVTGYPVRAAIRRAVRSDARTRLGLSPVRPVILVFGGSQGARRLNSAVADAAPMLLARADLLHIAGTRNLDEATAARARLNDGDRSRYQLHAYLHDDDMAAALAAANLVVSRAGASVLGEYPARGLPSVLVPLPIAGGHQALNAAVMESAGAALVIGDADLDGARLAFEVSRLLDEPGRLAEMSAAAAALDRPDAAARIWSMVVTLVAGRARTVAGAAA